MNYLTQIKNKKMNDKIKNYLKEWRIVGNIYASQKAAQLASFFSTSWFKDQKMYQQGSKQVVNLTSRERQMAAWEEKNGSFKEQFPNLWEDYLIMKDK